MQAEQNLFDSIKNTYRFGGMTIRLIFINTTLFLLIQILSVIIRLMMADNSLLSVFLNSVFTLNTDLQAFIFMPWGLVTSIFAHFSLWHFLLNMKSSFRMNTGSRNVRKCRNHIPSRPSGFYPGSGYCCQ
jgi:membrane associated rhomboid family serine protease